MFDTIDSTDVTLVLDGYEINGAQDIQLTDAVEMVPINYMGGGFHKTISNGPKRSVLSFSRYDFNDDPFYHYVTGGSGINGKIRNYNNPVYFSSGYFNSYTAEGAVGDFPRVTLSANVYSNVSSEDNSVPEGTLMPNLNIVTPNSIGVTCSGASTNNVVSYTYSLNVPNSPFYAIGSSDPKIIYGASPIEINASFTLEVDDYKSMGSYKAFTSPILDNVAINMTGCNGSLVRNYNINNATFLGESYDISKSDRLLVTLNYLGYINR